MSNAVHSEYLLGYLIEILPDSDVSNPFEDSDCMPEIISWHRRYDFTTPGYHKGMSASDFEELAKENGYHLFPLFMFDHSGLSFSLSPFGDRWDSGQLGYMFWTPEKQKTIGYTDEYIKANLVKDGKTFEQVLLENMEGYCKLLDQYARGVCYGYRVTGPGGDEDSCWGFFGEYQDSGILEEARDAARTCEARQRGNLLKLTDEVIAALNAAQPTRNWVVCYEVMEDNKARFTLSVDGEICMDVAKPSRFREFLRGASLSVLGRVHESLAKG